MKPFGVVLTGLGGDGLKEPRSRAYLAYHQYCKPAPWRRTKDSIGFVAQEVGSTDAECKMYVNSNLSTNGD